MKSKFIIAAFLLALTALVSGCASAAKTDGSNSDAQTGGAKTDEARTENPASGTETEGASLADGFSFSLTWNCYGVSSYDSASGKLVKTTDSTHPQDYVTEYKMSPEELAEIYSMLIDMDVFSYPDEYNPIKGNSIPSRNIILTVNADGRSKTVKCMYISLGNEADGAAGEKFMRVHDKIVGILTNTEEWKALPEYEFLYE